MNWTRNNNKWTSGQFEIVCMFYYFKLYYDKSTVGQYNTLQIAQEEAKKYNI